MANSKKSPMPPSKSSPGKDIADGMKKGTAPFPFKKGKGGK